jgi:tetratricopeptide (TPR) repeat protein
MLKYHSNTSSSVFVSFLFLGYVNYVYFIQVMAFHTFPEPVAKELRKAIYYDKGHGQDPKKAYKYYKEALMVATDLRMNPFSDEFMGMRIRMAEFLEQHEQYEQAIYVLEMERGFCYEFMEKAKDRDVPGPHRTRILKMAVQLGVKLGKLYSSDSVDNPQAAQAAFVTAVETLLRERQRREEEGVKEDEGEWLKNEEIGASLEELGHSYLDTKQPELALPLFLQAMSLCPSRSCHAAMLSMYDGPVDYRQTIDALCSEPNICGTIFATTGRSTPISSA